MDKSQCTLWTGYNVWKSYEANIASAVAKSINWLTTFKWSWTYPPGWRWILGKILYSHHSSESDHLSGTQLSLHWMYCWNLGWHLERSHSMWQAHSLQHNTMRWYNETPKYNDVNWYGISYGHPDIYISTEFIHHYGGSWIVQVPN